MNERTVRNLPSRAGWLDRRRFVAIVASSLLAPPFTGDAQPAKVYRVGVVLEGGPYHAVIDGLRTGLKELGFEDGRHYVLQVSDLKGDRSAVPDTAKRLEAERVDLIFAVSTSTTVAIHRATANVPIVFYSGADPVAAGLVKSLAKPGGRLTGVHSLTSDLLPKRLEYLKEMVPGLRRALTLYDPENANARKVDALFPGADAMVVSQGRSRRYAVTRAWRARLLDGCSTADPQAFIRRGPSGARRALRARTCSGQRSEPAPDKPAALYCAPRPYCQRRR